MVWGSGRVTPQSVQSPSSTGAIIEEMSEQANERKRLPEVIVGDMRLL